MVVSSPGISSSGMIEPKGQSFDPSFPQIPVDLYQQIIAEFTEDHSTLVSLCLTSQSFKLEAERVLYHSMTLSKRRAFSHIQFLQTITNVERLALLVHTYRFRCKFDPAFRFKHLLVSGLQAMVNLRHLHLRGHIAVPVQSEWKLVACPKSFEGFTFQLETLNIENVRDTKAFFDFLAAQSELRRLTMSLKDGTPTLHESACQKLEAFEGNRAAIEAILPFCKISTLRWKLDPAMNHSLAQLAVPLSQIRVLSFGMYFVEGSSFQPVVKYFLSLEYLELSNVLLGELELVGDLQFLKGLVLTNAFSSENWEERLGLITPLFLRCSHLDFVDIQQVYNRKCPILYEHWEVIGTSSVPSMQGLLQEQVVRRRFRVVWLEFEV